MKTKIYIPFLLFSTIVLLVAGCSSDDNPELPNNEEQVDDSTEGSDSAESAPSFSLNDTSGNTVALNDFKDKVLVMFFFGNSCPPCKAAAPQIQSKLADVYDSNPNFAIIGLDQWNGNAASVNSFKSVTGVDFPLLLKAAATASDYKTTYDRMVVVDKTGKIRFRGTQNAENSVTDVVKTVETYLNK